jgi:NAD(P)-dependent dehydrogenase (short-subunit alcohol dehydrogenase family)
MHTDATRKAYTDGMPLHRYGTLEELAGAASFLASDDAAFVTGHTLAVDGGIAASGPYFRL